MLNSIPNRLPHFNRTQTTDSRSDESLLKLVYKKEYELMKQLVEEGVKNDIERALAAAIVLDELELVKFLVKHVPDVNSCAVGSSKTVFNEAISHLEPEMIKFFINHGADVNAGETIKEKPLARAIYTGNVDKIVLLIKHGAIADCEMLTYAIQHSGRGRSRSKSFSYSTTF